MVHGLDSCCSFFCSSYILWILSNFCKAVGFWKADTLLIMNVEQVFSADMFEAKFKGNVLSKSAGREYREKVKCVFAKKNDICINIGFRRDGLLLIRVHVYWWMSFWSQNLCHCTVYRKGGISSSSSCLDGIPTQWLLLYYGYNKSWMQYLTQVVGSCCFLILRCWHQGLAKMLLWFCVTFWDGSQLRKPFWGVRVFYDHRIVLSFQPFSLVVAGSRFVGCTSHPQLFSFPSLMGLFSICM